MLDPEQLKRDIRSAQEFSTIVKTMKTLAAVNIHQYDQAIESLHNYHQTLELGMQILLLQHPTLLQDLTLTTQPRIGTIVFGSDQGLCGRFNEQMAEFVGRSPQLIDQTPIILAVGARIQNALQEKNLDIETSVEGPVSVEGIAAMVQAVVVQVEQWREAHQVGQILLFHHRPSQGDRYFPWQQTVFPLDLAYLQDLSARRWPSHCRPQVFLDRQPLFSALFRQHFFVTLYRACVESLISENMSRLVSMQQAQSNITEHLTDLQRQFHQHRQNTITEELLTIISGLEALNHEKED
ncbi:F0F1 ATP synthase subunit gamma [Lyngbya confervoides]|uniref:F0F1 ATP synthase subunit gamma n=1 Tax=Lyngbya confervoides BDU141951 TaxID=1574623 RepID=A0ABD4T9D7_9CYAN|nr:F0F1 ATP synthase subunit gamma [Lyngbya confervoides]MCM1984942.1 F0F1 ATP synthase subunit gamma [Lyngbya confervoides BDU141951]